MFLDPAGAREILDALIAAFAMLGGSIAYSTGLAAARARRSATAMRETSMRINEGLADGFEFGVQLAVIALIIVLWTSSLA